MKKKNFILGLILCCFYTSGFAADYRNLYEKLKEVNAQWTLQTDIPNQVYTLPPISNEKQAIVTHLQWVSAILKARHVPLLNPQQRKNRLHCIEMLEEYAKVGIFPKNTYLPFRNPIFIDKENTFCAVGFLVKETGFEPVSRDISQNQNFAYVYEIKSDALLQWAETYGFSLSELAWIQPGYPPAHPTVGLNNGTGTTVYDILPMPNAMAPLLAVGSFTDKSLLWTSGASGYDWLQMANITGGNVYATTILNPETPIIGGDFTEINGFPVSNIAMLAPTGSGFLSMGSLNGTVLDLIVYKNEVYAAGTFGLAKWDGASTWTPVFTPSSGTVHTLHVWENNLYIGGDFYENNYHNIIRYDGTLHPLGNGLTNPVYAISDFKNILFAGGRFNPDGQGDYLWKFENDQWTSISELLTGNAIYSLKNIHDSVMFIGGDFNYFPLMGNWGVNLAVMQESAGYFYMNGSEALNGSVRCIQYINEELYLGGAFTNNGVTTNLNGIGKFDYTTLEIDPISQTGKLFPNPATQLLHFSPQNELGSNFKVVISNLIGEKIYEQTELKEYEVQIPITTLTPGVYLFTAIGGNKVFTKKFVKQ